MNSCKLKIKTPDFNLSATLDSGQVFSFSKEPQGPYCGYIGKHFFKLSQEKGSLKAETQEKVSAEVLRAYFDLERDLSDIYGFLSPDPRYAETLKAFKGLRLIRQDSWEALACFILSSNNNVKRIQGIYKNLCAHFNQAHASISAPFPKPVQIAKSHDKILRGLGLGYRAPFLLHSAQYIASNSYYLEEIRKLPYQEAKEKILAFPGIGPKVADCALLYGFQKYEAFPVDVWIWRIMKKLYFNGRNVSVDRVRHCAMKKWGAQAGYVQQYLFHGARMGIL